MPRREPAGTACGYTMMIDQICFDAQAHSRTHVFIPGPGVHALGFAESNGKLKKQIVAVARPLGARGTYLFMSSTTQRNEVTFAQLLPPSPGALSRFR